jgi:TPR repeat protein
MNPQRTISILLACPSLFGQMTHLPTDKEKAELNRENMVRLRRAAESGDPKSMYLLGTKISQSNEGKEWIRKSAESGYALAIDHIAYEQFYLPSIGKQLSPEERKKSALAYHAELERSFPKLLEWAHRGDLDSMYWLGAGRYTQYGLLSQTEAMKWLRRAAEGGQLHAAFALGERLINSNSSTESSEGFK